MTRLSLSTHHYTSVLSGLVQSGIETQESKSQVDELTSDLVQSILRACSETATGEEFDEAKTKLGIVLDHSQRIVIPSYTPFHLKDLDCMLGILDLHSTNKQIEKEGWKLEYSFSMIDTIAWTAEITPTDRRIGSLQQTVLTRANDLYQRNVYIPSRLTN